MGKEQRDIITDHGASKAMNMWGEKPDNLVNHVFIKCLAMSNLSHNKKSEVEEELPLLVHHTSYWKSRPATRSWGNSSQGNFKRCIIYAGLRQEKTEEEMICSDPNTGLQLNATLCQWKLLIHACFMLIRMSVRYDTSFVSADSSNARFLEFSGIFLRCNWAESKYWMLCHLTRMMTEGFAFEINTSDCLYFIFYFSIQEDSDLFP
jgi:hypothetical protein